MDIHADFSPNWQMKKPLLACCRILVPACLLLTACGTLQMSVELPPSTPEPEIQVAGWMGYVQQAPPGVRYDDYLVLLPEGVGELGIAGASPDIESRIVTLRSKKDTAKIAHFWGILRCGIQDYNNCQLSVEKFWSGTEPVEGWRGSIINVDPDAPIPKAHQPSGGSAWVFGYKPKDDAFVLDGKYPVLFGIASSLADNGLPVYALKLAELRDSGKPVQVWGEMDCGGQDTNGCTIWVKRLFVDEVPVDPYQDWLTYTNMDYGFTFKYPPEWYLQSETPASAEGEIPMMNFINLIKGDQWLQIGYRYAYEEGVFGTGMSAGDLIPREQTYFMGQQIKKEWLIYNEGLKSVCYDMTTVSDLAFAFRLDLTGSVDYETAVIPPEMEFEADMILSTFALLE